MPELGTIGIIAGLLVPVLILLIGYARRREGKLRKYYHVRWKKSSSLLPTDVLGVRGEPEHGFDEYYLRRDQDDEIRTRLHEHRNMLVVGNPLAGKTRTVFEALRTLPDECGVIIPVITDVDTEDFLIPRHLAPWRTPVLLLDDLNKYVDQQGFMHLVREYVRRKVTVVATCRSGEEYDRVCGVLEAELLLIFGTPVHLGSVSREEAEQVAGRTNRTVARRFDGNIGSIFLDPSTMRERFRRCPKPQRVVLRSVSRLYYAGLYSEREMFSLDRVQRVCAKLEGMVLQAHEWTDALAGLETQGFIRGRGEEVWAEEAYLEFPFGPRGPGLDGLRQVAGVFAGDPEALFTVADRASTVARSSRLWAAYAGLAVDAYRGVLRAWAIETSPRRHAITQNNLGTAYSTLAEVEEKGKNCRRAIKAFKEALRVRTLEDFPMDYGMTQNNLGTAYRRLAEVEEKGKNCRRAIAAHEEALRVRTPEESPIGYGMTQNNLGNAYGTLAEVEEKGKNCRRAIGAYEEALRVYTFEDFPMEHGGTQNNLGNAYRTLAEVEETGKNCRRAIGAYEEALRVYTLEDLPMDYGMTQNNLGTAYRTLAEVEEKEKGENCRRAIGAYNEALRVRPLDDFPMAYAMTQNNLGIAYSTLAEVEERGENCRRAIAAYQAALSVYAEEELLDLHRLVTRNLVRTLQGVCAEEEGTG
jgi:tetratricopeptide (TPR) repeat protein